MCVCVCVDPVDYSPPDSSVHGIPKARILNWVAIRFSGGSSWPRDQTLVSCIADSLPSEPPGKPRDREKKAQIPKKPRGNTESYPNISLGKSSLICFLEYFAYFIACVIALHWGLIVLIGLISHQVLSSLKAGSMPNFSFCFQ